jgi:uncharacterized membrane protein
MTAGQELASESQAADSAMAEAAEAAKAAAPVAASVQPRAAKARPPKAIPMSPKPAEIHPTPRALPGREHEEPPPAAQSPFKRRPRYLALLIGAWVLRVFGLFVALGTIDLIAIEYRKEDTASAEVQLLIVIFGFAFAALTWFSGEALAVLRRVARGQ